MYVITTQNFIGNYYETNIKVADKLNNTFSRQLMSHQPNKVSPMLAPKKRSILPSSPHKPGRQQMMSINTAKTSKAVSKGEWKSFATRKWGSWDDNCTWRKPSPPLKAKLKRAKARQNIAHSWTNTVESNEQILDSQMNKYYRIKWTNTAESNVNSWANRENQVGFVLLHRFAKQTLQNKQLETIM